MFANVRPFGREYRITPRCFEKAAGRASAPPKSPARVIVKADLFGAPRH